MSQPLINTSLKQRVLRSGAWVIGDQFVSTLIRFGGNIILARLLMPESFGLMAVVYVAMFGFALFSDIGLAPNIIQSKRGEDRAFLDTAWIIQILQGVVIWLMAVVLSAGLYFAGYMRWLPPDSVYAHPELPLIIVVHALSQLIAGLYPTKRLVLGRKFALGRLSQIEITAQAIGLLVTVTIAYLFRSIWALVLGSIVSALVKLVLFHFFLPGDNNRWHWEAKAFKEIIGFGKWIFLSSILGFLIISGDRLLLGGLVDANQLGVYSIAFIFVSFPGLLVNQVIGQVAFPALSEVIRNNPSQLRRTYYKFRLYIDSVMLLVSGCFFCFGSSLIQLFYDSRYQQAGSLIEVLSLSLVASRYALAERCYLAMGKPNLLTPLNFFRLLTLYLLVPAAFYFYQFEGAIWAIALTEVVCLPMVFYLKIKHGIFDWKRELVVLPIFLFGEVLGTLLTGMVGPLQLLFSSLRSVVI